MKTGTLAEHNGRLFEVDITFARKYYLCDTCQRGFKEISDAAGCCGVRMRRTRTYKSRFAIQLDTAAL